MKRIAIFALLFSFLNFAYAEDASMAIQVKAPVIDSQIPNNNGAEIFMSLINNGTAAHQLIAVICAVATKLQLHATTKIQNKMSMQQIHAIPLSPNSEQDLQLDNLHIMMMGLKRKLIPGEIVPITLIYDDGTWQTVDATVS